MKYNCTDAAALSINDDDEIKSVERQDINGNYLHQIFLFLNIFKFGTKAKYVHR